MEIRIINTSESHEPWNRPKGERVASLEGQALSWNTATEYDNVILLMDRSHVSTS